MLLKKKRSLITSLVVIIAAALAFAVGAVFASEFVSVRAEEYAGQVLFYELNGSELVIAGNSTDFADGGGASISFKDAAFDGNKGGDNNAHWHAADKKDKIEKVRLISGYPTSMYRWFADLPNLTTVCFEGSFSSYKVEDMKSLFSSCTSLRKIDLSRLNFSSVKYFEYFFYKCSALTEITWGVSKPTSKATAFYAMYKYCEALETVDLSGFDMSGAKNPNKRIYIFDYSPNIKTIVAPQALPDGYSIELRLDDSGSKVETFWNGENDVTEINSESLGKTLKLHNSHDYKDVAAKAATCTESGVVAHRECTVCEKNFDANNGQITSSVVIPQLGHSYGEWKETKPATCTEGGVETRVCSRNSAHTETRETSALGHTVVIDSAIAPTCTKPGKTQGSHCSVCKAVIDAQQTIEAKGHTLGTAATCTKGAVCETCNQEYGEPLGHDYTSLAIVESPREHNYRAFDRFLTSDIVVNAGCGRSGCRHIKEVESTEYNVIYPNGDCLHVGDTSVTISYAVAPNKTLTTTLDGITVQPKTVIVTWQYNLTPDDETAWTKITDNTEFTFDPVGQYAVRAMFADGIGNAHTFREFHEHVSFKIDGKEATSIGNAGEYEFTLDTATELFTGYSAADYTFNGKTVSFKINRAGIELNNTSNFYWLLQIDDSTTSALRDGYVQLIESEGGASYYKYFSESGDGRIPVIRSIVRDRNKAVTVKLFGARASGGVYTIAYGENGELGGSGYSQSASDKYTAHAVLTIANNNYEFIKTGELEADRHMTAEIRDDGSVLISKEWYIAKIDNGLLSQQVGDTYGKEWSMSGWTYGGTVNNYAPRLEHGDPGAYGGTVEFGADNELVAFELFRVETTGTVNRVKLGETFNRYDFDRYINSSVPVGQYVLAVHVGSYTSVEHEHWFEHSNHDGAAAGIFYDSFTREFNFTVSSATLTANVYDLNGKTFEYDYDGELHLYDDTFALNAPVYERTGIWANAEFNGYYGGAVLFYNLDRWSDPDNFIGSAALNAIQNASSKPVNADTYIVRFIIRAPNYGDVKGDGAVGYSFTVKINKAVVEVPENVTDTLMKQYVFAVSENAKYGVKSGVVTTFSQAGTYYIVLQLNDPYNYMWATGENVDGDEATIAVTLILHDHDYGAWHDQVAATCTATGIKGYKDCSICEKHFDGNGAEITDLTIEATGHTEVIDAAVAPTCTENGKTEGKHCSVCHAVIEAQDDIAAMGHSFGEWTVSKAATVDEFGEEKRVCAHDGAHIETRQTAKRIPQLVEHDEGGDNKVVVTTPDGFEHDIRLVVTEIAEDDYEQYQSVADTANGKIDFVYDVTLKSDGVAVQPDGTLTIKLLIPKDLRGKSFKLFHLHDGTATETEYDVDGNYAVVTADRLSEFIFVGEKRNTSAPTENDTVWIVLIVLLCVVVLCEIAYVVLRKTGKIKFGGER